MADNRNHPDQSHLNAKPRQSIISGQSVSGNFSANPMALGVAESRMDYRPTLHKGDMGDFVPIGEIERIQNGTHSPPPWW